MTILALFGSCCVMIVGVACLSPYIARILSVFFYALANANESAMNQFRAEWRRSMDEGCLHLGVSNGVATMPEDRKAFTQES
jgi:hypothetical protein